MYLLRRFFKSTSKTMGAEAEFLEACRNGETDTVKRLLNKKRSTVASFKTGLFKSKDSKDGQTSPHRPALLSSTDWNHETALHLATLNNHRSIVRLLLDQGADVTSVDSQGCTALHLSSFNNNEEICQDLLNSRDAEKIVNVQNKTGDTALHTASQYGHNTVVSVLLKHHANPAIRNIRGESCLDLSSFYGQVETVRLLLNEMSELLKMLRPDHSPLHLAARNGQTAVVKLLLSEGFNINLTTPSGTALHESAVYCKSEVFETLLRSGINTTLQNSSGQTVEALLIENCKVKLYQQLLDVYRDFKEQVPNFSRQSQSANQTPPSSRNNSTPSSTKSREDNSLLSHRSSSSRSRHKSTPSYLSELSQDRTTPTFLSESFYDTVRTPVSSESIYDTVKTPRECTCPRVNSNSTPHIHTQSPILSPASSRQSTEGDLDICTSIDSESTLSDSPFTSLSPPPVCTGRKQIGNIYMNVGHKSTPSLLQSTAPKKPPREPLSSLSTSLHVPQSASESTHLTIDSPLGDYVQLRQLGIPNLDQQSDHQHKPRALQDSLISTSSQTCCDLFDDLSTAAILSRSISHSITTPRPDLETSRVDNTSRPDATSQEHCVSIERAYVVDRVLSVDRSQYTSGEAYENADVINQIRQSKRKKPKVTPRRKPEPISEPIYANLSEATLLQTKNAEYETTCLVKTDENMATQQETAVKIRSNPHGNRVSRKTETRILNGIITDPTRPITAELLLTERLPSFSLSLSEEELSDNMTETDVDLYAEWKQIDGIFAEMGCGDDDSQFLHYLQKGNRQITVADWLERIGLSQYENVLVVNGFDSLNMLNGLLDEEDLELMGITNTNHINTIIKELSSLSKLQSIDVVRPPDSVSEWLSELDLSIYLDNFYLHDYTTMSRVLQIWHVELSSVLSITLLGHQKRILVSLGENRPGFSTLKRRTKISDISNIIRVKDIKYVSNRESIYFKQNFSDLKHTGSVRSDSSSVTSLGRSDSGCSIGSDETRPDIPQRSYRETNLDSPPVLPQKSSTFNRPQKPARTKPELTRGETYGGHSQQKQIIRQNTVNTSTPSTAESHYLVRDGRHDIRSGSLRSNSSFYTSEDYANLTESGRPLVGNVEGLKLSKAKTVGKRILNKIKRPLPDAPPIDPLTFSSADLPADFKGIHRPDILINGCINYSSCYLGTCLVPDFTGAETTREAISKMKDITESIAKLPIVTLAISYKGVAFIDSSSKNSICEHEITNIFCAAQDGTLMNYFAYITKDALTMGLYCHVFCVKSEELSREIILTLGEAFNIAYYASKKHKSLLDP